MLRKMIKKPDRGHLCYFKDYDKEYTDFVFWMIDLKRIIEEENEYITPRQLDDFLLFMAGSD